MFLFHLNELNNRVEAQLRDARLTVTSIVAETTHLPRMEFVKADHSTMPTEIPTHKINLLVGAGATLHDCVNKIVQFVFNAANEFTKPKIHMSQVYLNYNPKKPIGSDCALSFDIAIWDYDGHELNWLVMGSDDQFRLGHDLNGFDLRLNVNSTTHELLKQTPFEINLWTANIVRDVKFITASGSGSSTLEYVIRLEQELLSGARNAAEVLHGFQRAAQVQDCAAALWRGDKYQEAADLLAKTIQAEVGIYEANDGPYLTVDEGIYRVDQVFAFVAGLPVEEAEMIDPDFQSGLRDAERANRPDLIDSFSEVRPVLRSRLEAEVRRAYGNDLPDDEGSADGESHNV
jgi:hypothetical protein